MDGYVWATKFITITTATSAFKWLEVLKRYIGHKLSSKSTEAAITLIKAGNLCAFIFFICAN